jgi:hypothetical protein
VFQALQTVTEEETQRLTARLAEVDSMTNLSPSDKSYMLGYYLLDLVGADFLKDVLARYGDAFSSRPDGNQLRSGQKPADPTGNGPGGRARSRENPH